MARCIQCRERTLDGRNICFYCEDSAETTKVEGSKQKDELNQAENIYDLTEDQLFSKVFSQLKRNLKSKIDKGISLFIYQTIEIKTSYTVDSSTHGFVDDSELVKAGLAGWQIQGVVPKTHGIKLENVRHQGFETLNTWAGAVGGNVTGAFVFLSLELTSSSQLSSQNFKDWCRKMFDSGFDFENL